MYSNNFIVHTMKIFKSCKGQGRCVSEFPERYLYLRGSFNKKDVNVFQKL